jgi:multisubunit Na+/H+ antiporter MnhF subunit
MSIAAKLKIESMGMFLASVFYIIVGILCFAVFALTRFPPHFAIIGIVNLVTFYGLLMKRSWSLYLIVALFLTVNALAVYTLYYTWMKDVITEVGMLAYVILTWIATIYMANKRSKLAS